MNLIDHCSSHRLSAAYGYELSPDSCMKMNKMKASKLFKIKQ
jgi:hypothetical protein